MNMLTSYLLPLKMMIMVLRFTALVQIRGINPFVAVTATQAARLQAGWRGPMPVVVRVNGMPEEGWRINMMPDGSGGFLLYLHEIVRRASGTAVGDHVKVSVAFDKAYRPGPIHPLPPLLKKALRAGSPEKKNWDQMTPSRQKEVTRYLASLKSEEALARNIEKILKMLRAKG